MIVVKIQQYLKKKERVLLVTARGSVGDGDGSEKQRRRREGEAATATGAVGDGAGDGATGSE